MRMAAYAVPQHQTIDGSVSAIIGSIMIAVFAYSKRVAINGDRIRINGDNEASRGNIKRGISNGSGIKQSS